MGILFTVYFQLLLINSRVVYNVAVYNAGVITMRCYDTLIVTVSWLCFSLRFPVLLYSDLEQCSVNVLYNYDI